MDANEPHEYLAFLKKFEAKKTTDDCYTPPEVYTVVRDWAVREYDLRGRRVVRPFVPGGDYTRFEYQTGDVVIDNPPFSIFTEIMRFYESQGVDFFLFGPALTLFSGNTPTAIITDVTVEYENGAKVATSFTTNLDRESKIRTAPDLKEALEAVVEKNKLAKTLPKYSYPYEVVTAARLGKIATVDFKIPFNHCGPKIGRLESQRPAGKGIFGGGFLISELKAAELKAAELKAAKEITVWGLSDAERSTAQALGQNTTGDN